MQASTSAEQSPAAATAVAGLAHLVGGDADAAVEHLQDAVYLEPTSAAFLNDLAAAHLVRGRPTDLLRALEQAEVALDHVASWPVRFNRAIALERLGLLAQARQEWRAYAESGEAGWRQEAAVRLQQATVATVTVDAETLLTADATSIATIATRRLGRTRQVLEDALMPLVADECARAPSAGCRRVVAAIRRVAEAAMLAAPRDSWWRQVASQAEGWGRDQGRQDAAALRAHGEALKLFAADRVSDANVIFRSLSLSRAGVPVTVRSNAQYQVCVDDYLRARHEAARRCLDKLDVALVERQFFYHRGRLELLRAQISLTEGDLARASADFDRAIAMMTAAADSHHLAAAQTLQATLYDLLGEFDAAWSSRITALGAPDLEPRRRHTLLTGCARSALRQGLPRAALVFLTAASAHAEGWGQPGAMVEVLLARASVERRLGRIPEARRSVDAAKRRLESIEDTAARTRLGAEIPILEGELLGKSSTSQALAHLARAARGLGAMQYLLLTGRLEASRAETLLRARRSREALEAYESGLAALEHQQRSLTGVARMQARDLIWNLHEGLLEATLEQHGVDRAFAVAERSRAQGLDGRTPAPSPATPSDVIQLLPPGTTVLSFAVLEHQIIRWQLTSEGVAVRRFAVTRDRLAFLVRGARRSAQGRETRGSASRELYALFQPEGDVAQTRLLVVIPDGPLHDVNPGALRASSTEPYLLEEHATIIAPSLRHFLSGSRALEDGRLGRTAHTLIVEGRRGGNSGPTTLPALPGVPNEVRAIRSLYPEATLLRGEQATPDSFVREAARANIVHYAGHAVADRTNPDLARLFLAPSASNASGWVTAARIQSATFTETRLVVLGACETGAGPVLRGEGALSVARPWLGKGVGGVVYSLWSVDDRASARLLVDFHQQVRSGVEPAVALQQAQLAELRRRGPADSPAWAAFQYAGGIRGLSAVRRRSVKDAE